MPCHVDPIYPSSGEIDLIIIVNSKTGKVEFKYVGNSFYGTYPKVKDIVKEYTDEMKKHKKNKTFSYETNGHTIVVITPCPKGC